MRSLIGSLACLIAACTGTIATPKPTPVEPVDTETKPGPFEPQPAGLRLLTPSQYEAAIVTLFGPSAARRAGVWHTSLAAAQGGVAALQVEAYEHNALDLSSALFASSPGTLVGCPSPDAACTRAWLQRTGRVAFRRPLTSDELARYEAVAATAVRELAEPWAGLEFATAALLQSPNFLYRVELASGGSFDPYALASRLSFTLVNAPPDQALLAAAEDGTLAQADVFRSHARRLIADPRSKAALEQLLNDWLQLDDIAHLEKDPLHFPTFDAALAKSMRDEVKLAVTNHLLDEQRDFRDLFDTRVTFVDRKLAQHYGLTGIDDLNVTKVTLPEAGPRAGLLGYAGVLAAQATPVNTSPTLRGKFVRSTFLCQGVPPPPPEVDTTLPPPMPGASTRDRLEEHRKNAACATCHALMDPIGFGLEGFDAAGKHRTESQGVTLDTSGKLDGVTFTDARSLSAALKNHKLAANCFVRQVYRYATGHIEAPGEAAAIYDLEASFVAGGYTLPVLLEALVMHQAFKEAAP
ncbi:MAG: DUF1592 domain-containing protein [Myxococcaceae bacterium]|nr:DUF1592 domain-containing protein [Myxococcaceae bacterium]